MGQFKTIFQFEFVNYLKNKVFAGVTVFLVLLIAVVMFFPRIATVVFGDEDTAEEGVAAEGMLLLAAGDYARTDLLQEAFRSAFPEYEIALTDEDLDTIKRQVLSGLAEGAFVLESPTSYTYYVENLSMYDANTQLADEVLQNLHWINSLVDSGLSAEEAGEILAVPVAHDTVSLGKDQIQNFFYTYIMVFALYMVVLLYGQMVATNVASEKSSRAMELLITSAKPTGMMFGKVFASCLAGLIQLVAVFGSAVLFYSLNRSYWAGNMLIDSLFGMPVELFVYMLIFFVLGFLTYAFLYGAIGSTVSKLEDINTAVMPVTLLFIAGFLVVMFSMSGGEIDNLLMRICSFIPFTSPMAMFTRIAMSTVPFAEVLISILILMISVVATGFFSAKVYRVGVLLYGNRLKLGAIIKAVRKG
ncbi:MAG: ABC transporter permease [Lachnospiraceae bacterium]|nr:ABC transporter permease [Lachnospiraceae bacterium]